MVRRGNRGFERLDIPGFHMSRLIAIAADSHGTIWLCDRDWGAFVWRAGRLAQLQPPVPSVDGNVNFVYVDRRDHLWIGYPRGKVVEVRADGETITHALGATIGAVLSAVYEDRNGAIWIGGSRGLGRIQGNAVQVFPQPTALPGNGVFAIAEDLQGDLWLGVSSGVLRLRQSDVQLAAEGSHQLRYRFYDASDGLVGVPPRASGSRALPVAPTGVCGSSPRVARASFDPRISTVPVVRRRFGSKQSKRTIGQWLSKTASCYPRAIHNCSSNTQQST